MAHRSVESIIGRLATDEGFRRRFVADPLATLSELTRQGCELTAVEIRGLACLDAIAIDRFASIIDPRLQKVDAGSPEERTS